MFITFGIYPEPPQQRGSMGTRQSTGRGASVAKIYVGTDFQYCQTRSVNILTRVCRELTRLSRSKHALVNILTIGQLEHP